MAYFCFEGLLLWVLFFLGGVKPLSGKHPRGSSESVGYDLLGAQIHFETYKWTRSCPHAMDYVNPHFSRQTQSGKFLRVLYLFSRVPCFYMRMLLNRFFFQIIAAHLGIYLSFFFPLQGLLTLISFTPFSSILVRFLVRLPRISFCSFTLPAP